MGQKKINPKSNPQKAPSNAPIPAKLTACLVLGFFLPLGQETVAASLMSMICSFYSGTNLAKVS